MNSNPFSLKNFPRKIFTVKGCIMIKDNSMASTVYTGMIDDETGENL